jgi:uncharacterized membrane protein
MQCPACHNEVEPAAFCNLCGAPLSAAAPATPPPPAAGAPMPPAAASSGIDPKLASAIAYLTFIPAVIFLMVEPYNKVPLIRFHSYQSIGLFVVALAIDVVFRMLPFGLMWAFSSLISLAMFVVWLIVVIKAFQGEWFKLPIIGDFAMKQAQG